MTPTETHTTPAKISRTEIWIIYVSSVITFAGFLTLWFYLFIPAKPIVLNHDIKVEQAIVEAEGARTRIVFALDYCKNNIHLTDLAEVHYSIKDGMSYDVPGTFVEYLPAGCHVVKEILIVPELTPGRYQLEMYRFYKGPLRETLVQSLSNYFDIKY